EQAMARREGIAMREDILTILGTADRALGAYAILEKLRLTRERLAPTSVYRALNALVEDRRVHRIESANAFVLCCHGGEHATHEAPVLSICDDCGIVEEHAAPDVVETVRARVGKSGFTPAQSVIEVRGHCAACSSEEPA
ncbi:MAG: transcriptional repressor, partial [Pseudomonadota bacterium]